MTRGLPIGGHALTVSPRSASHPMPPDAPEPVYQPP